MKHAGRKGGRALLALATIGAVGALSAAPAAADVPTVTGTAAVGGTLVVSSADNTMCDGQSASVAIRRPTGPSTAVHIASNSTPLVAGVPWTISITIPPTDLGGTALTPGMQISVDAGGICNAFGDQFSFSYDEVLLTLGQPVTAPTTTTTTPAPATTATTVPPTSPPTTAAATATVVDPSPTSVAAAGTSGGAADATLPRTGASDLAATVVGMVALALGGVALLGSRRRPLRRS